MTSRLALSIGQYSARGRKDENQDCHGAFVPDDERLVTKGAAFAVADGISTSRLGRAAAETAVKSFLTDYFCTSDAWSVRTSGERVVAATNSWLHAQNGRPLEDGERERGMICTLSALVLRSRKAHVFHVGDARIARIAEGTLEALTTPHQVSLGGGESFLSRALGANYTVQIDYAQIEVHAGDLFVLSTDGVHDHLGDGDIAALAGMQPDLDGAARAIAEAALNAGSGDNLTVQLVSVDALPGAELGDLVGLELDLPPAPQLRPGTEFAGYAVVRELHSGSRSHVYLARDLEGGQAVALKVPATDAAGNPARLQELLLEEWVMRRVDHPNLLKAPPAKGRRAHVFSVAEYVEGRTLAQWMRDRPRPGLAEVRSLVRQIAAGLQALHRREMLHRDLRPENVLVDDDDAARIIDFGSVWVAGLDDVLPAQDEARFAGTMQYSAPELYLGHPATRQSDLYSLGVIAYRLLTGELPYGAKIPAATSRAAQRRLAYVPAAELNPEVPDWLDAALAKAVAIDPSRRYAELSEFLYDLEHPNPSLSTLASRPLIERAPARVWQGVAAALGLALGLSLLTRPPDAGATPATPDRLPAPLAAGLMPQASEQWSPEPPVVTPGAASPAPPPSDALVLFDGKDLSQWVSTDDGSPARWTVKDGVLTVAKGSGNIETRRTFTDYQLHLEWRVPPDITGSGQGRGNSGLFLASTGNGDAGYELQILDSYRNKTYVNGQAGSVYKQHPPLANPMRPPGEWQSYDVVWTAPRFHPDGNLDSPGFVTAFLNGVLVQNHTALHGETVYAGRPKYRHHGAAPIKLQDHRDPSAPISFRNIWVRNLPARP